MTLINHTVSVDQPVRERQEGLLCDGCDRWNHRTCNTVVSRTQYREAIRNDLDIDWQCKECRETQHDQPSPSSQSPISSVPAPRPSPTSTVQLFSDESSLEDPSLDNIEPEPPTAVTYDFVEYGSIRKKVKLVSSEGYTYNIKANFQTSTHWQCTIRPKNQPCRTTVKQIGNLFFKGECEHNHTPNVGILKATKIAAEVKKRALADIFKPASAIVDEVLLEQMDVAAPCPALQKPEYLARNAIYTRQQLLPKDPVDLEFELGDEHLRTMPPSSTCRR